eukprot:gene16474-22473_t
MIPKDIIYQADQIEIMRMLGKIDIQIDKNMFDEAQRAQTDLSRVANDWNPLNKMNRATTVRLFEAKIQSRKCFLKEYLPIGYPFGKRELSTSRKLTKLWNEQVNKLSIAEIGDTNSDGNDNRKGSIIDFDDIKVPPPFPVLIGSLKTDERIETQEFKMQWAQRFPRIKPPEANNLWLIYKWDDTSFRTVRKYPPLPQIIEGLDYFRKEQRLNKRWKFIRKILRKGLEALDFIHKSGYCHNAINSESIWLSTTNQQEIDNLFVQITDLGACQKFSELGPYAKESMVEDLYQLGFVFLELVLASFSDDNFGAQITRTMMTGIESPSAKLIHRVEDVNRSQLSQKELQQLFETQCQSDFKRLREFV